LLALHIPHFEPAKSYIIVQFCKGQVSLSKSRLRLRFVAH
jgi:hypothetical protein